MNKQNTIYGNVLSWSAAVFSATASPLCNVWSNEEQPRLPFLHFCNSALCNSACKRLCHRARIPWPHRDSCNYFHLPAPASIWSFSSPKVGEMFQRLLWDPDASPTDYFICNFNWTELNCFSVTTAISFHFDPYLHLRWNISYLSLTLFSQLFCLVFHRDMG